MNSMKYNDIKNVLMRKKVLLLNSKGAIGKDNLKSREDWHGDTADIAETSQEQEKAFYFITKKQRELRQIEMALSRIDEGEYGFCAECDEEISKKRLEIQPYSIYCVECQEKMETNKLLTYG